MVKKKKEQQVPELVVEKNQITLKPIKCRNSKQKHFLTQMRDHEITICDGIAGSGKTFLALYEGLLGVLTKRYDKLILCKSVISTPNENIGFVPGTIEEKMEPHIISYKGNMRKMLNEESNVERLFKEKKVEVLPLAYIRGVTLDKSFIIIDESQNITMELFKSIITRIGEDSKMIFLGDVEQVDFEQESKRKKSALQHIINLFKDEDYIGYCHFDDEDVVRNPIIPKIIQKLRDFDN
jgi:phosphate starvation-inducible protein PhoH and related proteins